MNALPEYSPDDQPITAQSSADDAVVPPPAPESAPETPFSETSSAENVPTPAIVAAPSAAMSSASDPLSQDIPSADQPLFQQWYQPPPQKPVRIPHLGHLVILGVFALFGLLAAAAVIAISFRLHWFGIVTRERAMTDIHYTLGSEVILYLVMFAACLIFFPMIWHKGFFAGVQWNGTTAFRLRHKLFITASVCFGLALINGLLLPGPKDAPIDKIFRAPGAAWLLFGFGVTLAPFFEELVFRGFLLPSLCTACDWAHEKFAHVPMHPLDETGQPLWSMPAMIVGAVLTSLPFALMHGAQTSYSVGPMILLVCVSLVLCWARLSTRSLAASVLVHASYNFLLFFLMMLGTSGFRHLDKM